MDDLLDLSWQPTQNSAQQHKSTSSLSSPSSALVTASSKPNYYASSSFATHLPSNSSTPTAILNNGVAPKPLSAANTDAFSSLFSPSSSAKHQANLSLAERQKLANQQALQKAQDDKRRNDALWSGIESSSFGGGMAPSRPVQPKPAERFNSPAPITSAPPNPDSKPKLPSQAADLWDFDAFSAELPTKSAPSVSKPLSSSPAPPNAQTHEDPFDFDSFDQPFSASKLTLHRDNADQSDDILGQLAMPVSDTPNQPLSALDPKIAALSSSASTSSAARSRVPSPASSSRPNAGRSTTARSSSPPPHVIGQIVEMGFSPLEARRALAQTDTGINVEAALELLVGGAHPSYQTHDNDEHLARRQAQSQSGIFRDSDNELGPRELEQQRRHRHQEKRSTEARAQNRIRPDGVSANQESSEPGADWQQQADQLYAQASEIGTSVLNKASAFWSSAKAQAQKALEERNRAAAERSTTPSDAGSERHRARRWGSAGAALATARTKEWEGKPKWMIHAELTQAENASSSNGASNDAAMSGGGFKDSDNEDDGPAQQVPEPPTRASRRPAVAPDAAPARVIAAATAVSSAASALWSGKTDHVGANLSRQQSPAQAPPSVPSRPAAAKAPYASPNRRGPMQSPAPSPIPPKKPLKRRPIPPDVSHSILSANRNKQEGNQHFRRGAYGDAEASYTRGISALESSSSSSSESIRLVPLLSNRANVRLKNGDALGTIADCDQLLAILLSLFGGSQRDVNGRVAVYRASQEAALPAELAEINLRETYGKALVRRAQALEASERWKLAKADWEVLLEYEKAEGSGVRTAASNMKFAREDQQQKQAAEEMAKFALKDSVDAKIEAWKRGKETNLRALLSSLDTIVWPELGWKPIALHQVLDQAGLKKNYTKAIARLHPDKIKKDATTEQKMVASAAFHALNEAWNAQQA
uniref:Fog: tpr repeat n=1 Tax=Melanopsichium pennsylvanicum 4 TaxID=1398559 RepID=A0A077R063_9BASI|nr:fog: tpr repeat [Melanopsichium pennsylvanicum 4]